MNYNNERLGHSSSQDRGSPQVTLISQLLQVAPSMHHVDEIFLWLAHTIMQRFSVPVVQFWAAQANRAGQFSLELRTTVRLDPSLPAHVIINTQVADLVGRLLSEEREVIQQPIQAAFSAHMATVFQRYGLHYWSCSFLKSDLMLPPPNSDYAIDKVATPLRLTIMMFFPHGASPQLHATVRTIMEQAISVAKNYQLLSPVSTIQQPAMLSLHDIIPYKTQQNETMRSSSPFSSAIVIPDRLARQLYQIIDGRKTVSELEAATRLSRKDVLSALHYLFSQNLILLYDRAGKQVHASLIFT